MLNRIGKHTLIIAITAFMSVLALFVEQKLTGTNLVIQQIEAHRVQSMTAGNAEWTKK